MSTSESFKIELPGRSLLGTLHWSDADGDKPLAAALICVSPDDQESEVGLATDLTGALVDAGFAAAVYRAEAALMKTDSDDFSWSAAVDDASAVFRWLALHDRIDMSRLGVIGYGRGAVVASCLSRRSDQIAGLCLVAPCAQCTTGPDGSPDETTGKPETDSLRPIEDAAHFDRPTLVLVAGADLLVPMSDSQSYLSAMENVEHQVEHLIVARASHGFDDASVRRLCIQKVVGFFKHMPALVHAEPNL